MNTKRSLALFIDATFVYVFYLGIHFTEMYWRADIFSFADLVPRLILILLIILGYKVSIGKQLMGIPSAQPVTPATHLKNNFIFLLYAAFGWILASLVLKYTDFGIYDYLIKYLLIPGLFFLAGLLLFHFRRGNTNIPNPI